VASSGRHTRSHPQLPLATPEENPEVIIRKGKSAQGESSASQPGISPPPSVKTPFSCSHFPSRPVSEVSRFLNFGSVPAEFSPPGLVPEREILVTPSSLEVVPQHRPRAFSFFSPSSPSSPIHTPSPPGSPLHIPMAGTHPPMTRMEAIIAARYAPLVLPQPLNALPADGYLKQLPKFMGEGDVTAEEHLAAFYGYRR
jgi:hypothetical protein